MERQSEPAVVRGAKVVFLLASFAALVVSLAHLAYQYLRLGDAYARLLSL